MTRRGKIVIIPFRIFIIGLVINSHVGRREGESRQKPETRAAAARVRRRAVLSRGPQSAAASGRKFAQGRHLPTNSSTGRLGAAIAERRLLRAVSAAPMALWSIPVATPKTRNLALENSGLKALPQMNVCILVNQFAMWLAA